MRRCLLALGFLTGLAACGGTSVQGPATVAGARSIDPGGPLSARNAGSGPPEVSANDSEFANLINGIRRPDGAGSVSYNRQLNRAAQGHADDMLNKGYFSHTSLDGRELVDRIRATGYRPKAYGENIAQGFSSNADVLRAWQNSPAHNRLLLADSVDEFGLGVAGRGAQSRWVLVMAAD